MFGHIHTAISSVSDNARYDCTNTHTHTQAVSSNSLVSIVEHRAAFGAQLPFKVICCNLNEETRRYVTPDFTSQVNILRLSQGPCGDRVTCTHEPTWVERPKCSLDWVSFCVWDRQRVLCCVCGLLFVTRRIYYTPHPQKPRYIHHMAITVWGINVAAKLPVYLAKKGIQLRIVICDCCPLKKNQ